MSKLSVGRSHRTPAKHSLMDKMIGREIGAGNKMASILCQRYYDLTAGDGVVNEELTGGWSRNCSPGIAAFHARNSEKPIEVLLYEKQPATFDRLLASLGEQLPLLGYEEDEENEWICNNVHLRAVNGSGSEALTNGILRCMSVLVSNDPNAITDWAMRSTFAMEIASKTPWFRSISTMGCNPAGLKRLPHEERLTWFDQIQEQIDALPAKQDLLLVEIEKDDAQWAYLLSEPIRWRARVVQEVERAFGNHGMMVNYAWFKEDLGRFNTIQERLFLTKKERAA